MHENHLVSIGEPRLPRHAEYAFNHSHYATLHMQFPSILILAVRWQAEAPVLIGNCQFKFFSFRGIVMIDVHKLLLQHARFFGAAVLGIFALALGPGAQAQNEEDGEAVEEIIVTGSHVPRNEFSTPIPVSIMDVEDIEIGGIETLDGLLQQLPSVQQVTTARESTSGTDRSGVASVALRGLGVERTLTLLDGKRMVSSRTGQSNVDLSTIPIDFIERIEVITGGASAIYGSDALAGVINIITKKDFEGVRLRTRGEVPEAGGEENFSVDLTLGSQFAEGRGHAMFSASFFDRRTLFSRDRPWAIEATEVRSDGTLGPDFSSFTPGGRYDLLEADGTRIGSTGSTGGRIVLADGLTATRPFVEDIHGYNTNELASITTPIRRYNFAAKTEYQVSDAVNLSVNGYYARTDTISNRGPENTQAREYHLGQPFTTWMLPLDNPFIPQSILDIAFNDFSDGAGGTDVVGIDWRRRFTELNRFIENTRETFRFGVALDGDINEDWDWNVGLNYGRTQQSQLVSGNTIKANVVDALDVELDPSNPGQYRCVNPQSVARGCVPLNIFGEGSITPEMAAWIKDDSTFLGSIEQMTLSALVTGEAMQLPAGPLGVAIGAEYREDDSRTITDSLLRNQGTTFVAVPSNSGSTDVGELFVEAVVPLISDAPGAHYLGFDVAVRYADYSHIGGVTSYKTGFEYAPVESLRFRGGYSLATRAPSILEAFSVPRTTTFGKDDPCDGITAADAGTVIGDNCLSIPAIAAEVTANGSFDGGLEIEERGFNLGNPALFEEQADTVTIGFVYEPEFLPGFGLSVDYWDIDISDAIVDTSRQISLDLCYESVGFSSRECSLVFRDGSGQINRIDSEPRNESGFQTSGVDVYSNYLWELNEGSINFEVTWTHLNDKDVLRNINNPDGTLNSIDLDDDAGEIENPTDRVQVQASYNRDNWRVSWLTNILGEVNTGNEALADAIADGDDPAQIAYRTLDAHYIHKLNGSYTFGDQGQYQIWGGINNVFDEDPPLIPDNIDDEADRESGCVSNCSQYDPVGRSFFIGFTMSM